MTGYQRNPSDDYVEQANVTRLARTHGLAGIDGLRARSVADTAWYRDAAATRARVDRRAVGPSASKLETGHDKSPSRGSAS